MPSGTLWATCNIGANSPEEAGMYFAWGETSGYTAEQVKNGERTFDMYSYKYGVRNTGATDGGMSKYPLPNDLTTLELEDDAANVYWGVDWRMPTYDELNELLNNTDSALTVYNGESGIMFTSKIEGYTDKFVFLPMCDVHNESNNGFYWSSSLYDTAYQANSLSIYPDYTHTIYPRVEESYRENGCSVRPVRSNN